MAKVGSRIVADAQKRNKDKGGGRLTINLTPEENEIWSSVLARHPKGRGQQKAAFMAALRAVLSDNGGEISRERLIEEVRRRLT